METFSTACTPIVTRLENSLWLKRQPKGSLKVFAKVALQYFYLQVGLLDAYTMEVLNTEMTASHMYTGFKIMAVLGTTMNAPQIEKHVATVGKFFSTYFWKDYTFLGLDTQKEFMTFVQNLKATSSSDQRFTTAYCDLLMFSEEGLLDEDAVTQLQDSKNSAPSKNEARFVGSLRVTVSVLIFNTYLFDIFSKTEALLRKLGHIGESSDSIFEKQSSNTDHHPEIIELERVLSKTTRFVKYMLSLLEITASSKQRRKEITLRIHFDFFYLGYLSLLFGLEEKARDTPIADLFKNHCLQILTFLLVLVEFTDSRDKNFTTIVKMRRQRFSVQCDSLAYKMCMELLLVEDKPLWELESFDFKKVRYPQPGSSDRKPLGQRSRSVYQGLDFQHEDQEALGQIISTRFPHFS
jgi:hypothetical protein